MSAANPIPHVSSGATGAANGGFRTEDGIPVGRRSAPRLRLAIPARLISLYGHYRCILIDLSSTGAQLGLETPLDTGETVILEIAGRELLGDIVRKAEGPNGGANGLTFDPPLSEEVVLDMRRFAETYELDELRGLRSEVKEWVEGTVRVRS